MDAAESERWRAAIGRNAEYYLRRLRRIEQSGGGAAGWNWAAFLNSTGWFWYRRMYGWALLNLAAPFLVLFAVAWTSHAVAPGADPSYGLGIAVAIYVVAAFVLVPLYADVIYLRRVRTKVAQAAPAPSAPSVGTAVGGTVAGSVWLVGLLVGVLVSQAFDVRRGQIRISWAVASASGMRDEITDFYAKNGRPPALQEVHPWAADPSAGEAKSVLYEPAQRRIVITMRESRIGSRIALYFVEEQGRLHWRCRAIDAQSKYLPPACRGE